MITTTAWACLWRSKNKLNGKGSEERSDVQFERRKRVRISRRIAQVLDLNTKGACK